MKTPANSLEGTGGHKAESLRRRVLYPLSYGRTTGWRSVYYSLFCRWVPIRGQVKRTCLHTLAEQAARACGR